MYRSPGAPITPAATTSKVLAPLPPKSPEMIRRQQLLQKTNVDVLKFVSKFEHMFLDEIQIDSYRLI